MNIFKAGYWAPSELIVIGTFTGLIKTSTLLIALAGGGMNPVTLMLKNTVATSLLIILVHKVRKFGVLTLFSLINCIVSLMLMGGNPMSLAGTLVTGLFCDLILLPGNGVQSPARILIAVAVFDFLSRTVSLGYFFLLYREEIRMFIMGAAMVGIGYLGCLAGLGTGVLFVKELKHAGIIRE